MSCLDGADLAAVLNVAARCTGTDPATARVLMVYGAWTVLPPLVLVALLLTTYLWVRR